MTLEKILQKCVSKELKKQYFHRLGYSFDFQETWDVFEKILNYTLLVSQKCFILKISFFCYNIFKIPHFFSKTFLKSQKNIKCVAEINRIENNNLFNTPLFAVGLVAYIMAYCLLF